MPHQPPVYAINITLPTALTNSSLSVQVVKYVLKVPIPGHGHKTVQHWTRVVVNGQSVSFSDGVASNGAVHVIGKLLNPRARHPGSPHRPHKLRHAVEDEVLEGKGSVVEAVDEDWEDWEDWLPQWAEEE